MKKQTKNRAGKASITVYLSLVLVLILSLLTTTLEAARVSGFRYICESMSRRVSQASLASYSTELYDSYHIFAKDMGTGTAAVKTNNLNTELEKLLEKNLVNDGAYLWKFTNYSVSTGDSAALTDYDGAFFRRQAVEYMEYRGIGLGLEKILSSLDIFTKTEDTVELMDEKEKAEDSLLEIDRNILALISCVEGIKCTEKGISQNLFGKIVVSDDFVKRLYIGKPTMAGVIINNGIVYAALEDEYTDPTVYLNEMKTALEDYRQKCNEIAVKEAETENLKALIKETDSVTEKAKYSAKIVENSAEIVLLKLQKSNARSSYEKGSENLKTLVYSCKSACKEALEIMKKIEEAQVAAAPSIVAYSEKLKAAADWLENDTLVELSKDLKIMEAYLLPNHEGIDRVPDFSGMKKTLSDNDLVLMNAAHTLLKHEDIDSITDSDFIEDLTKLFKNYSFSSLRFDYSGFNLKTEKLSPMDNVKKLIKEGVSSLLLPGDAKVSERNYGDEDLPSDNKGISSSNDNNASLLGGSLSDIAADSPISQVKNIALMGASALTEKALYLAYLNDHFSSYSSQSGKPGVCAYELEYVLNGQKSDKQNLYSTINKILLTRLIFCEVHVISDGEKTAKAKELAVTVLGFTGMPMLIEVFKYLVMFVWGFDEALVETSAILSGKKVALVPTKKSFQVGFDEIFLINKAYIDKKVESRPDDLALSFDYEAYLNLFLLLQNEKEQNLRTMDIIQENIRISNDSFRMAAMLYGFNASFEYELAPVFSSMPFSRMKSSGKYKNIITVGTKY